MLESDKKNISNYVKQTDKKVPEDTKINEVKIEKQTKEKPKSNVLNQNDYMKGLMCNDVNYII